MDISHSDLWPYENGMAMPKPTPSVKDYLLNAAQERAKNNSEYLAISVDDDTGSDDDTELDRLINSGKF